MSKIPYRPYSATLAAGAIAPHRFQGRYIRFLSAGAELEVRPVKIGENLSANFEPLPKGTSLDIPDGYDEVIVRNPTGGAVAYTLVLSVAEFKDNRFTAEGSIAVRGGGDAFTDDPAVSVGSAAVEILAANSDRTAAIIRAGAAGLWLGPDNTVAASGVATMAAGEKMTITHTGAVWAIRSGGASDVGVYEETSA